MPAELIFQNVLYAGGGRVRRVRRLAGGLRRSGLRKAHWQAENRRI